MYHPTAPLTPRPIHCPATPVRTLARTIAFCLALLTILAAPKVVRAGITGIITNRAPLLNMPFVTLPLGSIQPQGWLLTQCQLQRDGLTGHAEDVYASDLGTNSAWLGGTGDNWERSPYYFKGLVPLAYTLNDAGLKLKAQKWMDWLLNHQGADGYLGPAANNDWWPRMPATYALRDYYEATGDARVPTVLSNYFRYMLVNLPGRPLVDWGKARAGDEMDVALWLYNRNGDTNLLSLVTLLRQQAYDWVNIFSSNTFMLYGTDYQPKHNVNVEQALKFPAVYYQYSHQTGDRDALYLGLANLMREHGLAFGINSGTEFLSGNASVQGVELCSIVEAMLSLETDIYITGDASLADRLEGISFNALPAAVTHDFKAIQYFTLPNNVIAITGGHGYNQDYVNATVPGPNSGYPCCRYTCHMGWPKFIQNSWAATSDGGLALLTYGPVTVNSTVAGQPVQVSVDTAYPFEEQVRIQIGLTNSLNFPLQVRIPGWCTNATVSVNGQNQAGVTSGTFLHLQRTWTNGDMVVLNFPMSIRTQSGPSRAIAISRGPLVYSLRIGENWTTNTADPLGLGFNEYLIQPTTPWNYALQLNPTNLATSFVFTSSTMPTNPFDPAQVPVTLLTQARPVPSWGIGWRGTHAFEPPLSPVASTNTLVSVQLVPFGAQHLHLAWFPYLGIPAPITGSFYENFDPSWSSRWTVFGGNWSARNGSLNTMPASAGGVKALVMATQFTNFTYEADVSVGPVGNAGVLFRTTKPDIGADTYCGYYAGLNAQSSQLEFGYASNGWHSLSTIPMSIGTNTTYHLKVDAAGTRLRIYVADMVHPAIDLQDSNYASGMVGVRNYCTDGNQSFSSYANIAVREVTTLMPPVLSGLDAWYPFEGNGQDLSGNGNNGVISGNVTFGAGKLGALAAQFDGTNSYVQIPRCVSTNFTIAFWFKTTATGGTGQWFNGKGFVDGEVFGVTNDFGTSLVGDRVAFGVGNPDTTILSTNSINDGRWHHATATRDASTGQMQLYIDGGWQAAVAGPPGVRTAPPYLRIGSLQTGVAGCFLSGTMDDVQILDHVASAAEIVQLMNHAPALATLPDTNLSAGRTLAVTNQAVDVDAPLQTLTFSLLFAPVGATISPTSGLILWRPAALQAGSTNLFTVQVMDNGTPSQSATQSFHVTVAILAKPQLSLVVFNNSGLQMQVNGDSGSDYTIQVATNLSGATNWTSVFTNSAPVMPFSWTDFNTTNYAARFYRVLLTP